MLIINDDLIIKIEKALDTVRPYLLVDKGDVKITEITPEGILRLELLGSCGTCPMSTMTMKTGIEEAVKNAVPEILHVIAINGVDADVDVDTLI
ncbi:MAG: NifU family protein [Bacteroidetes bacterium]|nr:MAG: NifU family protein [Bacteroidota bacterium]TAG86277.1 MAG: NifU family protein [Bacteroidota bacterium]